MQLELEAMEKQICNLVERQAQLREQRAALETSQAEARKSWLSIQKAANSPTTSTLCVSLHRPSAPRTRSSQMSFTPRTMGVPAVEDESQAPDDILSLSAATASSPQDLHPEPLHSPPLHKTERDAVIVGDSIVQHVRAMLAEGKVYTHCFPGARVLAVSAQIPTILKGDESIAALVLHARVNVTKLGRGRH